jgi:hypothetical protein
MSIEFRDKNPDFSKSQSCESDNNERDCVEENFPFVLFDWQGGQSAVFSAGMDPLCIALAALPCLW